MARLRQRAVYRYKKGEVTGLSDIYEINGLFNSDWWEPVNDTNSSGGVEPEETATQASGETIRITRDITIVIERTYNPA